MTALAAVMTGKGTGAISTVQIFGDDAQGIIAKVFRPAAAKPAHTEPGRILLGEIIDGSQVIDQVTIGCEEPNCFAINCHGNPLIVEMIMGLLKRHGADLVTAERLLAEVLLAREYPSTIHVEATLAITKAKTLAGAKILANQTKDGLVKIATGWLQNMEAASLGQVAAEAKQILQQSQTAKLIIEGCTVVLAGPANTGKSTLLNYLSGRQKAIVTDIKGTTRDWVSAEIRIEPLMMKLVDTAGLDRVLAAGGDADRAAQEKARELIRQAELVLLVLDGSRSAEQIDEYVLKVLADKTVVTVLNKSDLPARLDPGDLPESLRDAVRISARFGAGIDGLTAKVHQSLGVDSYDLKSPVCFTERQERLLEQIAIVESKHQAAQFVTELLRGQLDT